MKNCCKEPPTKNLYFEDVLDLLEVSEISDGGPYGILSEAPKNIKYLAC